MRRKDREITDREQIFEILKNAKVLRLGLFDDEYPYVVPLHYGFTFRDDRLAFYAHGAREGLKLDLIRRNPNVCVELDLGATLVSGRESACRYGASYASIIARGTAVVLEDCEEKRRGLELLMKNQTGRDFEFDENAVASVAVIRIDATSYSAKARLGKLSDEELF